MTVPVMAGACAAAFVALLGAALAGAAGGSRLHPAGRRNRPEPADRLAPWRTASTGTRSVVAGMGGVAIGWLVAGVAGAVGGLLVLGALPRLIERRRAARRAGRVQEQLIDAVAAIASAIRAGRSLVQSLAVAADEVGEPLATLLAEAGDRAALGVPIDEVLDDLAARMGGPDARLVTGVLRLHRRTGGALAASLDDLVRTLRARRDGARELGSLTAQARLSAAILGLLPLGFFLFLSVVARRDVEAAYRSTAGASAIGVGLALQGAAFVWIRRLLRVGDR